ncbi:LytS/YhcK type 5TM receptor domain-containing protein [Jannaschia aquimarina]|uniref:5TMR of 5TMR-LYT n=1 Tax=Jannaschia aquimarina TaxID=935700 RepID=A0A0D1EHR4_9RHOB|nr:LytS/YhcK type 5TM receptor domain-containing protein [Jannaschia aquimarina]KIT16426.1 5TMR of 5TMR-LYT [Jannaschia aquimarina]SNS92027.1 5TMR of 5TMR-LYT [Jannaschia aquimarina]
MSVELQTFTEWFSSLAILAVLASGYGLLRRSRLSENQAHTLLGGIFGAIAFIEMHMPLEVSPGLIFDLRAVPVVLAGAFLGWRGLLPCLLIAIASRLQIGGVGAPAGVLGLFLAGSMGLLWARLVGNRARDGRAIVLLGVMAVGGLGGIVLLPYDVAIWSLQNILPVIAMALVPSVAIIAALLEREVRAVDTEKRLKASVSVDPETGLMTFDTLQRELAHRAASAASMRDTGTALALLRPGSTRWISRVHGAGALAVVRGALRERLARSAGPGTLLALTDRDEIVAVMTGVDRMSALATLRHAFHETVISPVTLPDGNTLRPDHLPGMTWEPGSRTDLNSLLTTARAEMCAPRGRKAEVAAGPKPLSDQLFERAARLQG